ncbi:hypothetical protein DOTSEDRAFT_83061 [Lecanosticta acicola]|uniref:Uncharacterized protein n=1 Tax=Lecanosticta acicola TaxID=111012 RepID=A0AAI9EAV6_9PEZI|nr:hypothetical protein DOTSEDRAFT_83061 [Lecanosticta acicola]
MFRQRRLHPRRESQDGWSVVVRVSVAYLDICALTAVFQIVETVPYARKRLGPVLMVVLNTITTVVWIVLFSLSIVGAAKTNSALGFIWTIMLVAACLAKLIYSSVMRCTAFAKNRSSSRGAYTPADPEAGVNPTVYTAYNPSAYQNPAGPPSNPFRDSRDPSPTMRPAGDAAH